MQTMMKTKTKTAVAVALVALAIGGTALGLILIRISNQPADVVVNDNFTLGPGDYDFKLQVGDLERRYLAHVPKNYNKSANTPAVIYIHGGGGSSAGSKNDGLYNYSDKYGFILLSPAGTGILKDKLLVWNLGPYLINGNVQTHPNYASEHNVDDVGFFSKMIDDAESKFNIDKNRIYATGLSQGGMMSYRSACELSDKIAAIAPVASPAVPMDCSPSRPISVMHIHGTADPCVPYNGGMSGGCMGTKSEPFQSSREMVDRWLNIDKCSPESSVAYQKGKATCVSHDKCEANSEVELCTVEGMGHTYPSGSQYLPVNQVGPVSYDISFDQIWEFFKKNPIGASTAPEFTLDPGDYNFSLQVGDVTRKYLIHVPNSYKKTNPAPLVLAFHGGLGNSATMANDEHYQWISKSNAEGFIVAFPNGASRRADGTLATFNAGNCCGYALESNSDDVGFVKEAIKDIESKFNINKDKVFATGMSNGGMMSYRLACDMSDTFAAIAAVAGTENYDECHPKNPIRVMHIHSLVDDHVLFNGGCGPACLANEIEYTSVPETISRWTQRNKCIGSPLKVTRNTGAYCETYARCADNVQVKLCVTTNGGHSWPGAAKAPNPLEKTAPSQQINATDEIWNFFKMR